MSESSKRHSKLLSLIFIIDYNNIEVHEGHVVLI